MNRTIIYLTLGLAALLTLAILGYKSFSNTEQPNRPATKTREKPESSQAAMQKKIQAKLPNQKNKMVIPAKNELQGKWHTTFNQTARANLTITEKNFELIYTDDPKTRKRKYSRGFYKYNEKTGEITLYPSKKYGKPAPIPGVTYKILTTRHFNIFISKEQESSTLYLTAPEHEIISKSFHPLFLYADYTGAPVLKFSPIQKTKQQ